LTRLLQARRVRQRWEGVQDEEGILVHGVQQILGSLRGRWGGLWSEEEGGADETVIESTLEDWRPPQVEGLGDLTLPVTVEEIQKVLAKTKLGTAPGEDGLPWDFWKKMVGVPGVLKEMAALCDVILQMRKWIGGQDLGLVTLLYKEKGSREDWRNWRPIMLLDMDRKLFTKVIVARLQGVAQQVLGEEQRGFVGGRLI